MSFWDTTNAQRPTGIKDPNAILDYPINFSEWLTDVSDTYQSHTITTTGGLVVNSSTQAGGVITPVLSGGTPKVLASFTIRIVTAGGRTDDRTFYLNIRDR